MKLILFFTITALFHSYGFETERITVMTYNVENLFDTTHDSTNNDWTFLSLKEKQNNEEHAKACAAVTVEHWQKECLELDWNKEILRKKMFELGQVIKKVNNGLGPDILILQEIEIQEEKFYKGEKLKSLIEVFNEKYLSFASYSKPQYLRGPDKRGIGVVVLTRLPFIKGQQTQIYLTKDFENALQAHQDDTRGIIEVPLVLPGNHSLYVYGLHLPAQHIPGPGDSSMRLSQLKHLRQLILKRKNEGAFVLAAGDCNINKKEEKNLYDELQDLTWISHRIGKKENIGEGTYVYKKQWSFLDAIFVDNKIAKLQDSKLPTNPQMRPYLDIPSIKVFKEYSEQLYSDTGFPKRFNKLTGEGVSDHFPIILDLIIPTEKNSPSNSLGRRKLRYPVNNMNNNKIKIAFFDADSTLRVSLSGAPSANSETDVYMLPFVAEKIKALNNQGYFVAIVSNQGGVASGKVSYAIADGGLKTIINKIENEGGKIHYYDFASSYDWNRKGNIGMAVRLERILRKNYPGVEIDKFHSFMVGDAAHKTINFSISDRLFAKNYNLRFIEPDTFFGWDSFKINAITKKEQAMAIEKQINN